MLHKQWESFWKRVNAKGDFRLPHCKLIDLYTQKHRKYHTMLHIEQCFNEFEDCKYLAKNPDELEMAIWYHDSIYIPGSLDNEKQSAELAKQAAWEIGLQKSFGDLAYSLVLVTDHKIIPKEINSQLIADIDLYIFGRSIEEFDEYERKVRKEFNWVSDEQFKIGRTKAIKSFLNRPSIYYTDFFKGKYGKKAKGNLERSLKKLRG